MDKKGHWSGSSWPECRGRPRKTWLEVIANDLRIAELSSEDAQDQD